MVNRFKPLNRNQLGRFLPNHESVKAFEQALDNAGHLLPDAVDAAGNDGESALASVRAAFSLLMNIVAELDVVLNAPARIPAVEDDDSKPRQYVGTLGAQNHDDVDIEGGTIDSTAFQNGTITNSPISGTQVITGGGIQFDNAQNVMFKDSLGTVRNALELDAADNLYVINNAGGSVIIQVGASNIITVTSTGITFSQGLSCTSISTGGNSLSAGSTIVGNFGCNGQPAQSSVTADGTLTTVENALKACGIMS